MVTTPTRPAAGKARRSPSRPTVRRNKPPAGVGNEGNGSTGQGPGKPAGEGSTPKTGPARLWAFLEGSGASSAGSGYYLIIGATLALTAIGLMMVLSASAVEAIASGKSPYDYLVKQAIYAAVGLVLMLVLSRMSISFLKRLAWPALGLGLVLLLLVFSPLGVAVGGNRNWIAVGSLSAQPSEAAKLALALWMATVLARKGRLIRRWQHVVIPVIPVALLVIGLVILGHDLGTALILMMIVAAALFFAGAPSRMFVIAAVIGVLSAGLLTVTSAHRMERVANWLRGVCPVGEAGCYQSTNGLYALASGGWTGVGLGQGQQKWSWIPEAHNDFIFAIIGEELGLAGTLLVVALFGIIAVAIVRIITRHQDPFVRILSGSIMVWIIGQAFVNIGMVTGLLPVIGIPLPFISYGGSALVFTLAGIGVILAFARRVPATDAATTEDTTADTLAKADTEP
ncbi:FtsW/RodA/SpoVE family cell cycle protein [Arthrobacter pigmenti]